MPMRMQYAKIARRGLQLFKVPSFICLVRSIFCFPSRLGYSMTIMGKQSILECDSSILPEEGSETAVLIPVKQIYSNGGAY
ncbi:hypothetical protein T12_1868 [Trichinella patagoniensis]|uniref:Uncharacterized protein n=1 Tax=Trichinella patagoniensis TaxID=990121 RepID=A0A0V0ZCT5_9BILA|nr:hypothetical protein T12_1868 [Trichinella patagoniensis]